MATETSLFPSPAFLAPHRARCDLMDDFPSFGGLRQGPLLSALPPKLPSLEGILKRIHSEHSDGALTDDESVSSSSSSACYSPPPVQQMLSLRSILSPSTYHAPLSHKRSWEELSNSDAGSDYTASPKRMVKTCTGPQRSRASKYCKIEGCDRVSQRNNLCHSHGGKRLCKEDGCSSKDRGNGFCIKHGGGKICSIGGCDKKARRKGLCTQHYRVCDSLSAPFDHSVMPA